MLWSKQDINMDPCTCVLHWIELRISCDFEWYIVLRWILNLSWLPSHTRRMRIGCRKRCMEMDEISHECMFSSLGKNSQEPVLCIYVRLQQHPPLLDSGSCGAIVLSE
jgi:hypothetical protein